MNARNLAVALLCFGGQKSAAGARRSLERKLQTAGDGVVQTTIVRVNDNQKASVHDARRVLAGTLTAALTWGLFGLVAGTNRVESTIIWAVLGAICGGIYAYMAEHLLTKDELARIGRSLAPDSSALVMFAETADPENLLAAATPSAPTVASVALVDPNLGARVFAGGTAGDMPSVLSMLLVRYPDPKAAARVAAKLASAGHTNTHAPQVELVIESGSDGRRRVSDPSRGTAAWARSDVVSWGVFGLVFGAIVGYLGGGGLHGLVKGGVVTGIGWAVFGLFAGTLYGLWAGRSVSARRLKSIGPLLGTGTSALLAWADGSVEQDAVDTFVESGSSHLILRFTPVAGGAVLEGGSQ